MMEPPADSLRGQPAQRPTAWAVAAITALLIACLGGCAWLDSKQRELALRPTPGRPADFAGLRPNDLQFSMPVTASADVVGQVALWWLPNDDPAAPTLLYLHGTFRNLYRNLPKIEALRDAGFSIVAVDYRGWGDSSWVVPSEATITADAKVAWQVLVRFQPDPGKRVIFGHSLGGAVAVDLASTLHYGTDYAALVLESTFTNLPDVAAAAGFWGRIGAALTTLEFDSRAKIGRVDAPVLMLHGTADKTVPIEVGRRLRDAAPAGVRWIEVQGGSHSRLHSEAPDLYRRAIREVIPQSAAVPPTIAPASTR
jgi:pimeloyl-ACP methyl ester carboxylesterase